MCGAAHRLDTGPEPEDSAIAALCERLIRRLRADRLAAREAEDVRSVTSRIQLAREAFAEI